MQSQVSKDDYEKERKFLRDLLMACEKDDLIQVKKFEMDLKTLQNPISICDYRDGNKAGAIHAAARGGAIKVLEYLLSLQPEQGGLKDNEQRTPLMAALSSDHSVECVKYLLTNSKSALESVNDKSLTGTCAIHMAASLNNGEPLKYLLEYGKCDPNTLSNAGLPLHWASGHADTVDTCKILLDTGKVDVNAIDTQGCTPVIVASLRGKTEMVQLFCENKADLSIFANNLSPLSAASVAGAKECVLILLKYGGDELCFAKDPVEHLLPIQHAAHAEQEEIVTLLAKKSPEEFRNKTCKQIIEQVQKEYQLHLAKEKEAAKKAEEETKILKEEANQLFLSGEYQKAADKYMSGVSISNISKALLATLYCNASACYLKLQESSKAVDLALKAKEIDPSFIKCNFRLGQAYSALLDHEQAARAFWEGYEQNKKGADATTYLNLFKKEIELGKKAHASKNQQ